VRDAGARAVCATAAVPVLASAKHRMLLSLFRFSMEGTGKYDDNETTANRRELLHAFQRHAVACSELAAIQLRIGSFSIQQFRMAACFDDASMFEHHDAISP
jgi:hypothetical protein